MRVAQAAFPKSIRFMQIRDQLGPIYDLALITVMQHADHLSDRHAADAAAIFQALLTQMLV